MDEDLEPSEGRGEFRAESGGSLTSAWLVDQSLAFAATLLGRLDTAFPARAYAAVDLIIENTGLIGSGQVSDSTLALIATIDPVYTDAEALGRNGSRNVYRRKLIDGAGRLRQAVQIANDELERRDSIATRQLNRVLISHAVYLLKRPHLSALKILKWLNRAVPSCVPGIKRIIRDLQLPDGLRSAEIDAALQKVRNTKLQSRDRLGHLDSFHELVLCSAFDQRADAQIWWTRICMAYRSSLFCWPLLAEHDTTGQHQTDATAPSRLRGLSLPISLFVIEDGKSVWKPEPNPRGQRIWFKYKLTRAEEKQKLTEPRFSPPQGKDRPGHINGYRFGFTKDWWQAFNVGLDVAKKLWISQNGRFKAADQDAAERKLKASLNVDLRAACDITNAVFSRVKAEEWEGQDEATHFFLVSDRSAESYWVQCILSLLLPAGDLPMGVCTGTVMYKDGEFEIGVVEGVAAKLEYANRAGFPRAIVPGRARDYFEVDPFSDDYADELSEASGEPEKASIEMPALAVEDTQTDVAASPATLTAEERAQDELKEFLVRLHDSGSYKTIEVNFALTARAVADAMQPAGWRRTDFLRTPEFQRMYGRVQRRLFMHHALNDRILARRLKRSDVAAYRQNPWREAEERCLERLDRQLQSRTGRTVVHVYRNAIRKAVPGMSAEEALGAWAAWKDHKIRFTPDIGTGCRGRGLGVVTLRTAEGDTETRVWAALAEMLVADVAWWEDFQWAALPRAADLLGRLLCNHEADPRISLEPAPDLLFVFDDCAFATRRTNQVFPSEFHHEFIDLLNPRHPTNNKVDYLDAALKLHAQGGQSLNTRVIVVLHEDAPQPEADAAEVADLPEAERELLQRLSIFRFMCSRHAGFAMANFDTSLERRIDWPRYEMLLGDLNRRKLIGVTRNVLYLTRRGRRLAGEGAFLADSMTQALAHRHAALSLCPILSPAGARISTNRDRQLEPENVLEATWHLERASRIIPWRFQGLMIGRSGHPSVTDLLAFLTFLRTMPDWDTVTRLRINTATRMESVELCRELLEQADKLANQPSSMMVGLTIETMGRVFKNQAQRIADGQAKVKEIERLAQAAAANLRTERLSEAERARRLRHLRSRELFALRMLGLPLTDPVLASARACIDTAVSKILRPEFIEGLGEGRERLDDFPISQDCWRTLWSDGHRDATPNQTLTLMQRSRYAYAAARANLGIERSNGTVREAWDEPWIAYLSLTRPEDIDPKQISAPLNTWWSVYGSSEDASRAFGRRVLDMQSHARKTKRGEWQEHWLPTLGLATANLWNYVTTDDTASRLFGPPVAPALRLIRVLALQEVLPAYSFVKEAGPTWLQRWPVLATTTVGPDWPSPALGTNGFVASEWACFGRSIIGQQAAWVAMLSSLRAIEKDESRIVLLRSWLAACQSLGIHRLREDDPENLLRRGDSLPISMNYRQEQGEARRNLNEVLRLAYTRDHLPFGAKDRKILAYLLGPALRL